MRSHENGAKKLLRLEKSTAIDLEFQDLSYFVLAGRAKLEIKQILKSLSGIFCSGELTGILGGSGAGKTSLLNILAGYVITGSEGLIKINGTPRQMQIFHKLSTYVMQEDLIQPFLTVNEEVTIAAKLKLGSQVSTKDKELIVKEVLDLLGLSHSSNTMVEKLSGGQRRRLSIALELVSNPPIIFLDEPTSGLDSVALKQVIDVLKTLTGEGRTVICTIHQPSAAVMQQFHQVYFLANGHCVYNGSPSNILTFLNSIHLECPQTYSPSEYIIETVETNSKTIPMISKAIQNGKINLKDHSRINSDRTNVQSKEAHINLAFQASFWTQFSLLFYRMMLQQGRKKITLAIHLASHILCGLLIGGSFSDIINNSQEAEFTFKLALCIGAFYLYTYTMIPILLFPSEIKILQREYFNRWYGLKPYYLALTLRSLPAMFAFGLVNIVIIYTMSRQPVEANRFFLLFLVCMIMAIISESIGFAIGAVFNVTNGAVCGPTLVSPMVCLSVYGLDFESTIPLAMRIVRSMSYVRYALVALVVCLFQERDEFVCHDEIYCHYQYPKQLLETVGMSKATLHVQLFVLAAFIILFRIIMFISLRRNVQPAEL